MKRKIQLGKLFTADNIKDRNVFQKETIKNVSNLNLNKIIKNEEIKMINNFIEYKFFKEVMKKNEEID